LPNKITDKLKLTLVRPLFIQSFTLAVRSQEQRATVLYMCLVCHFCTVYSVSFAQAKLYEHGRFLNSAAFVRSRTLGLRRGEDSVLPVSKDQC